MTQWTSEGGGIKYCGMSIPSVLDDCTIKNASNIVELARGLVCEQTKTNSKQGQYPIMIQVINYIFGSVLHCWLECVNVTHMDVAFTVDDVDDITARASQLLEDHLLLSRDFPKSDLRIGNGQRRGNFTKVRILFGDHLRGAWMSLAPKT